MANDPELIAKAHIDAAAPDNPLIICVLDNTPGFGVGAGETPDFVGVGILSLAIAGSIETNENIPKIVVKPTKNDFRFDFGLLAASKIFCLNFRTSVLIFTVLFFILFRIFALRRESGFLMFTILKILN